MFALVNCHVYLVVNISHFVNEKCNLHIFVSVVCSNYLYIYSCLILFKSIYKHVNLSIAMKCYSQISIKQKRGIF